MKVRDERFLDIKVDNVRGCSKIMSYAEGVWGVGPKVIFNEEGGEG